MRVCEGVHIDTGIQHAREDAHSRLRLSSLRQAVLTSMATAGSCSYSHGRASVPLSAVFQDVRRQVQPPRTRPDSLVSQAVFVRSLRQGVRAQELPVQTRRVVLHARWSRRHREPAATCAAAGSRRTTEYYFRLHRSSLDAPAYGRRLLKFTMEASTTSLHSFFLFPQFFRLPFPAVLPLKYSYRVRTTPSGSKS